jgi:hypothetical protein
VRKIMRSRGARLGLPLAVALLLLLVGASAALAYNAKGAIPAPTGFIGPSSSGTMSRVVVASWPTDAGKPVYLQLRWHLDGADDAQWGQEAVKKLSASELRAGQAQTYSFTVFNTEYDETLGWVYTRITDKVQVRLLDRKGVPTAWSADIVTPESPF